MLIFFIINIMPVTGVIFNVIWLIVSHYFQLSEFIFPVHFILPIALFTGRATVSADITVNIMSSPSCEYSYNNKGVFIILC